jgi:hypothetical protein
MLDLWLCRIFGKTKPVRQSSTYWSVGHFCNGFVWKRLCRSGTWHVDKLDGTLHVNTAFFCCIVRSANTFEGICLAECSWFPFAMVVDITFQRTVALPLWTIGSKYISIKRRVSKSVIFPRSEKNVFTMSTASTHEKYVISDWMRSPPPSSRGGFNPFPPPFPLPVPLPVPFHWRGTGGSVDAYITCDVWSGIVPRFIVLQYPLLWISCSLFSVKVRLNITGFLLNSRIKLFSSAIFRSWLLVFPPKWVPDYEIVWKKHQSFNNTFVTKSITVITAVDWFIGWWHRPASSNRENFTVDVR